jgi:hypothetical protein
LRPFARNRTNRRAFVIKLVAMQQKDRPYEGLIAASFDLLNKLYKLGRT